ncbi:MAG: 3-phosphoglycerate dehydrogenase, partial [Clostridia bacterium]|nr:3-phosphoglycerate dehydrogenase [Clostridia bacterium]
MKNIKLLNKIAKAGISRFDPAEYAVSAEAEAPDGILVRSAAMHDTVFNPELKAIARCGAGVNNIPLDRCAEAGIVVFNTPGA